MRRTVVYGTKSIKITLTAVALVAMTVCSLLTGIVPRSIIALGVVSCCILLLFDGNLHLGFPFVMFYNELYGVVMGLSVYRIYSFLLVAAALLTLVKIQRVKVNLWYVLPFGVYFLYALLVMQPYSSQRALFGFFDVICCLVLTAGYLKKDVDHLKAFFRVYVLVAIIAFITGLLGGNTLNHEVYGNRIEILRYMATFEDPNYMGFFYTPAVFALVVLRLFGPKVRYCLVAVLYLMIFSTVSMTALVVNIALWAAYLLISKKVNLKTIVIGAAAVFLFVGVYQYGFDHPQAPVFGAMSFRIEEKLTELSRGDINSVTTGRTNLTATHLEYYQGLPLWKKLFGGTAVNCSFIDPMVYGSAHNEYVDWLLNIGAIGAVVMGAFVLWSFFRCWRLYIKENSEHFLFLTMYKAVWLFYAASLTMFIDYRFMVPFLM